VLDAQSAVAGALGTDITIFTDNAGQGRVKRLATSFYTKGSSGMKRSTQKHQEFNLERIFDPPLRAPAGAGQP
jgi:hypothetical protein